MSTPTVAAQAPAAPPRGMQTFLLLWLGQFVSGLGTLLNRFGLGVWVYQQTDSATQLALISFFGILPTILFTPLAGALVDRWGQRKALVVSDLGAAVCTLLFLALLLADRASIWFVYAFVAVNGAFGSLQEPALASATTLLVPKEQLGRANSLSQIGEAVGQLVTPVLTGVLVGLIGIYSLIAIDLVTFVFATVILLLIRIPRAAAEPAERRSLLHEALEGWQFIRQRSGLVSLLVFFTVSTYLVETIVVLATPLVLSFSDARALGLILTLAGCGMLVSSVALAVTGGPRNRVLGVLGGMLLSGVFMIVAGLAPSVPLIGVSAFFFGSGIPLILNCSQVIWQRKVAPELQGRVFAIRSTLATVAAPLAYLLGGPLVDYVFNPPLLPGGALAGSVGQLIGVGPGRGIGLLFMVLGGLTILLTLASYLNPHLRHLERELPDAVSADIEPAPREGLHQAPEGAQ